MTALSITLAAIFVVLFAVERSSRRELSRRLEDLRLDHNAAMCDLMEYHRRQFCLRQEKAYVHKDDASISVDIDGIRIRQWFIKEGEDEDYLLRCAEELADAINDKP